MLQKIVSYCIINCRRTALCKIRGATGYNKLFVIYRITALEIDENREYSIVYTVHTAPWLNGAECEKIVKRQGVSL